jgi:hypothetical protein
MISLPILQPSLESSLVSKAEDLLQCYDGWLADCEDAKHCDLGDALTMLDEFRSLSMELLDKYSLEEL